MAAEDEEAKVIYDAMILQLSKDIGSLAPVVCGKVDKIILTGGMAYSKIFDGRDGEESRLYRSGIRYRRDL